ncbi:MAG: hypothetical protein CMG60_08975 [Candidatus Marinimicrobia bacterium]|nr:hypothetical protein [Candidatus Neomarinimicrobiota bacterium]
MAYLINIIFIIKILALSVASGNENPSIIYEEYQHPIRYTKIDKHALSIKDYKNESIKNLTKRLTQNTKNDFEKARSIYRWITKNISYDVDSYFNDSIDPERVQPRNVLRSKLSVCSGYANLFNEMVSSVGIKSEVVSGFAKGYGFEPGDKIGESNHAWNAIEIDKNWYLVDCTWGSGNIGLDKKFNRKYVDFYFLTPPEHLIYSHFPDNSRWQLIKNQMSKIDFSNLPYVKPRFFISRFDFIGAPMMEYEIENDFKIEYRIDPKIKIMSQLINKNGIEQEGCTYIKRKDSKVSILVRPPSSGDYTLNLFSEDNIKKGKYSSCVQHLIKANENYSNGDGFVKLWHNYIDSYGINFESPHNFKYTVNKDLILDYDINPNTQVLFTLKNKNSGENVNGSLFVKRKGRSTQLNLRPQGSGIYSLNMFAKGSSKQEKYDGCAEYIIVVPDNYERTNGFVKLWGENIKKYKISFKDVHDYNYTVNENIMLEYFYPGDLVFTANLSDSRGRKYPGNVFFQKSNSGTSLYISSPNNNEFDLIVFAKEKAQKTKYKSIAEYKISGSNTSDPFPLQFSAYGELSAHLFSPMEGNLLRDNVYNFSLEIQGISKLSLIQNGKWTDFMKNGDRFIINNLKLDSGAVQIAAKNKKSNKYTTILEYTVL